ncbi:MAG: GreA/GreB family elongation factor [Thermomicrobiales bacterium]
MSANSSMKITAEGAALLRDELRELTDERLPELQQIVQASAEDGDLTDNSEWEESKDELARAERRIEEIQIVLDTYDVVDGPVGDTVGIGSTVTVRAADGEEIVWIVVNPIEVFVSEERISADSPVGSKLMGAKAGDSIAVTTPSGDVAYSVLAVN